MAEVRLPSQAGRAGTGLRPASEETLAITPRAIQGAGRAIGNIAEMAFMKAQQHAEQDKKIAQKKLLLNLESQGGQIYNDFKTAESPQQVLSLYDQHFETDTQTGTKKLKGLHAYGDDLTLVDTTEDPILDRYKRISLSDADKANYSLNKQGYLNRLESSINPIVAKARFDVFKETTGLVDQSVINNVRNGILPFEDGINNILSNYSDNGYPESVNAPLRESAIQAATKVYLEDAFDNGNVEIIDDVLSGQYDDELNNVYEDKDIVNDFKDKARTAKSIFNVEQAGIKYDPEIYGRDYNAIEKDVKKDKGLTSEEKTKVLQTAQVEINRRNAADVKANTLKQTDQKNEFSNLQASGDTTSAMKYINEMDAFEDFEKNKMRSDLVNGTNAFTQYDPEVVKVIESHFKFLDDNPNDVDMDELFNVIQDAWGKGINETQKKGFETRWRAINDARDKKADPLNRDDYQNADDRLETFHKNGGYLPVDVKTGDQLTVKEAKDNAAAWELSEKTLFEKKELLKDAITKDPKLNVGEWIEKNLVPQEEAHKKNIIGEFLDSWFGGIREPIGGSVELESKIQSGLEGE